MLRDRIAEELKTSLKNKDKDRISTIRLIISALKLKDIEARGTENSTGTPESSILSMLQVMIKQRRESIDMYKKGGRDELAKKEQKEIDIIQEFLPKPLSDAEITAALDEAITQTQASSLRDMGKVVNILKGKYTGRIDFSTLAPKVKAKLGAC